MKKTFIILLSLILLVGCEKTPVKENENETNETTIVDKKDYTNPLICKKITEGEYNTISDYIIYDFDNDGSKVTSYTEIRLYSYKENQTSENKERYEKWCDCSNQPKMGLKECVSSWISDKEYKVTKTFNNERVDNLSDYEMNELKNDVKEGYVCE